MHAPERLLLRIIPYFQPEFQIGEAGRCFFVYLDIYECKKSAFLRKLHNEILELFCPIGRWVWPQVANFIWKTKRFFTDVLFLAVFFYTDWSYFCKIYFLNKKYLLLVIHLVFNCATQKRLGFSNHRF